VTVKKQLQICSGNQKNTFCFQQLSVKIHAIHEMKKGSPHNIMAHWHSMPDTKDTGTFSH
jgi:hypothetical protein